MNNHITHPCGYMIKVSYLTGSSALFMFFFPIFSKIQIQPHSPCQTSLSGQAVSEIHPERVAQWSVNSQTESGADFPIIIRSFIMFRPHPPPVNKGKKPNIAGKGMTVLQRGDKIDMAGERLGKAPDRNMTKTADGV